MHYDRTLIQVRERSFLDLLDLALVVVRRKPAAIGLAALAGVAPFAALNAWLTSLSDFPSILLAGLLALEAPWATAPLTVVLGSLMFGERIGPARVLKALTRGLPAMFLYQFLLRAVMLVVLPSYPLIPARLAFLNEVILLERGKVRKVVGRSSILCGQRGADYLGRWLAQLVFGGVFIVCFWFGTGAMVSALTTSEITWDRPGLESIDGVRFQIAVWISIVFFGVARFLSYIDQRIRLEGWEINLRLQAVGRTLEEAARW